MVQIFNRLCNKLPNARLLWLPTCKPLPADDPLQRQPLIDLAQRELAWQPTVRLEQGLEPTIAWFRKTLLECDQAT